jgi:hypothetical protein
MVKDIFPNLKIGKRTILSREESKNNNSVWKFKCDCGYVGIATGSSLRRSGKCKKCSMASLRKDQGVCSFNGLYLRYKHGAASRNIEFNLSKDEFKILTKSNCFYCKSAPKNIHKGKTAYGGYVYNGIDRINSSQGYIIKNCVSCCSICNRAKSDIELVDFLSWIKQLTTGVSNEI